MATHQSIPNAYLPRGIHPQAQHGVPNNSKIRPNSSANPTIQYTPNDLTIPPKLYLQLPNFETYKKLVDAEREIDLISAKKELDFHVIHAKSLLPTNFKRESGILRVFIYNTNENQPWQKQLAQQKGLQVNQQAESAWTLKVEGKFLHDSGESNTFKFSSFLSGLSIDLIPNDDYPQLGANPSNIIEWRSEFQRNEFDGIDVKRPGIFNLNTKIAILVKDQTSKLQVSEKLSQFLGKKEATQQEIIYSIWHYVLYKDLITKKDVNYVEAVTNSAPVISNVPHHAGNAENDLTVVKTDDILQDLLGVEQFRFVELFELLRPHFQPRRPIIIDYEINTTKSSTLGEVVVDIPVELPLELTKLQREINDEHKRVFTEATSTVGKISEINNKIALGVGKINSVDLRRQFYKELNENPVEFVKNWTKSQLETLKSLKSDEGYNEEVVRRAKYFEENEDIIKEKIDILLGSTKM